MPKLNADKLRLSARIGPNGAIRRGFGLLKRMPGDKPFVQEWAEHKQEERELEDAKHARNLALRSLTEVTQKTVSDRANKSPEASRAGQKAWVAE